MTSLARIQPEYQLAPLDFVTPGFRGLNTVQAGALMDAGFCTQANNCVIDLSARLAARQGVTALTTTPLVSNFTWASAPSSTSATLSSAWTRATGNYYVKFSDAETRPVAFTQGSTAASWTSALSGTPGTAFSVTFSVQSLFEYNSGGGVYQQIIAWPGGISNNQAAPTNNLGGSVNVTNGRWFFQNFNNKCIGFQAGQKPIVYSGTGTFATVVESAGTAPTGGIGCAAFGRVWAVGSDLQTIQYSGLLDETDWSTTDGNAGIIDMHTIWSDGTDQVTAIFAWNASLVVCGTNHIIFFTDGRGSMLGMDPTQAYVFDMLSGTGVISQWTVDHIGEADIVYLSPNGVQSLQRLTTSRNNPLETLSKYNRDLLLTQVAAETPSLITGCFNNLSGFYILGLPNTGVTWCFDMRRTYNDDVGALCSITTQWTMATSAACSLIPTQAFYISRANQGTVGQYSGYTDEGNLYSFSYVSPWMNLGQEVAQKLKMLKRLSLILFTAGNVSFTAQWTTDFGALSGQTTQTVSTFGTLSQYGLGQYGLSQYGGGINLYNWKYAAHIRGQYYQLGISSQVTGAFALQQAQFAAKIGRIA